MRFRTRGGRGTLAASLPLLLVVLAGCSTPPADAPPAHRHEHQSQPQSQPQSPPKPQPQPRKPSTLVPSTPLWVDVPAIDAHSSLVPLGLNADRTVEVPPVDEPMQAGWYRHGPTPGEIGPSVVLGHVDGGGQDGVFARLHELRPGDEIRIGREDGQVARFVVARVAQVPKSRFPTEEVYGNTTGPELRLITCGGSFDEAADSYRDNVIAFAVFTGVVPE